LFSVWQCDKAGLNRKDIVKLRKLAGKHDDDGGDDVDSDGDLGRAEAKEAFVLGDDWGQERFLYH
jgi:hypothetical protein